MLTDDAEIPVIDRASLDRVITFANGKGGVGKTTLSANVGGLAAADDARVLVVDLNGQGNLSLDLGIRETDVDDDGEALADAVLQGAALRPAREVRPRLDVCVGGSAIGQLPALLASRYQLQPEVQALQLAASLQQVAGDYDLVVIDSPPENPPLQQLALAATRWLVVPVSSDRAAIRDGLGKIARQFALVRKRVNPSLDLLGVVLFGSGSSSRAIRREVRRDVSAVLGDEHAMFHTVIRHSEAVAKQARDRGLLVHELEQQAANNPAFWKLRTGEADRSQMVTATSASVAEDLADLTREVFGRIAELEGAEA
ncbi:ParA family protein [Streptomyces sp. NPDC088733]|uniref:ParA family protein n=1 Tax=Streptomyces sp. NPDC088733 TaxID=3365880 RepID=UPI0037F84AFC